MKVNKKLKTPMIVFGILLLLAGITVNIISGSTQNSVYPPASISTGVRCSKSLEAMRQNLISTLCLLIGLGVITFASRTGKISGIKLTIAFLLFIACIILHVVLQNRLPLFFKPNDCKDAYKNFLRPGQMDSLVIYSANACAIVGTVVLLL